MSNLDSKLNQLVTEIQDHVAVPLDGLELDWLKERIKAFVDKQPTPEQSDLERARKWMLKHNVHADCIETQGECDTLDSLAAEFARVREEMKERTEALEVLLYDAIERHIGEHDMMRCKVCGQEGHNEVLGDEYGIKHKAGCTVVGGWAALRSQGQEGK
jgi:hypothetical protein